MPSELSPEEMKIIVEKAVAEGKLPPTALDGNLAPIKLVYKLHVTADKLRQVALKLKLVTPDTQEHYYWQRAQKELEKTMSGLHAEMIDNCSSI